MTRAADGFVVFSGQHLVLIGLFLLGAVVVVLLGRSQRSVVRHGGVPRTGRVLAVALPAVAVPSQGFQLMPNNFALGSSLPLQLSDLAWLAATWALWTRRRVPTALTYYWGLTLSVQAILTPSLGQRFPDPRFLAFWAVHLMVVWTALYLTLGLGLGPRWREYRATVVVTLAWAVVAYVVDVTLSVNYGFLARRPASASLLDLLGPWPFYVLASLAILLAVWAMMTLPWTRRTSVTSG